MWFKQTDQKSPQQAEPAAARPQQPPAAAPAPPSPAPAISAEPPRAIAAPAATPYVSAQASRITPGLSLKGEISGSEELWVGGSVEGTLRFGGARVIVGGSGNVRGEVDAREIVIEGRLDGNMRAGERLAISRSGQVKGDAAAPRVAIEEGAVFNGSIHVTREGEPRPAPRSQAGAAQSGAHARPTRPATPQAAGAAAASGSTPLASAGIATGSSPAAPVHTGSDTSSGHAAETAAKRPVAVEPSSADSK